MGTFKNFTLYDHCQHYHLKNNSHDHHHAGQCPARKEMNANGVQSWEDNIYSDTAPFAAYVQLYVENHCVKCILGKDTDSILC